MDLTSLLGAFMGDDALTSIGTATNTSAGDVASVLSAALPSLIAGANAQATNEKTAESFTKALNQHSKDDTSDLATFVENVDLKDGKKVVQHLLGDDTKATTEEIAAATGVSRANTGNILAIAAPLLLSLLSGHNNNNTTSSTNSLLGGLLGGLGGNGGGNGLGSAAVMAMAAPLLMNLLSSKNDNNAQAAAAQTLQPAATAAPAAQPATAVDTTGATSLLGNLLSGLTGGNNNAAQQPAQQQPAQQQSNSGGLLSGLLGLLK